MEFDVEITTRIRVSSPNAIDALKFAVKRAEGEDPFIFDATLINGDVEILGGRITLIEEKDE